MTSGPTVRGMLCAATGDVLSRASRHLAWVGLAAFALALRVPLFPRHRLVEGDGVHYAHLARSILGGDLSGLSNPYWSNLWPAVLAATSYSAGNPNAPGLPTWPAYNNQDRATMVIDNQCKVVNDPIGDKRLLLMEVGRPA